MMSASEGRGSWKSGHSKGSCVEDFPWGYPLSLILLLGECPDMMSASEGGGGVMEKLT